MSGDPPSEDRPHAAAPAGVRSFVALYLPELALAAVAAAVTPLREAAGEAVRWTHPDALHLTLRFLGDVAPGTLDDLGVRLRAVTERCAPFDVTLEGAGAFPPRGVPRVVWVGFAPSPALAALHAGVDDACAAVGLPREGRPFRPHLTVGRVRPGRRPDPRLGAALSGVGLVAAARVTSLHLMASDLTPAGARHTPLGVYDLTPAGAPPDVPPDAPR